MDAPDDIKRLLAAAETGDHAALDDLFPHVYAEVRALAHRALGRRRAGQTLNTTALVHEAYLRLSGKPDATWESRRHFLAVAAKAMRHLLVDRARRRKAQKRGGGLPPLSLDETEIPVDDRADELLALNEALESLGEKDDRLVRTVELRFFAGLSVEETATVLDVSPRTVKRDWALSRAYLYRALSLGQSS